MQYSDNQWGKNFEKFSGKGITDAQIKSVIERERWSPYSPVHLLSNIRMKKKCFPLTAWRGCEVERKKREQRQKKKKKGEERERETRGLREGGEMGQREKCVCERERGD